jgi:hypothetical protein
MIWKTKFPLKGNQFLSWSWNSLKPISHLRKWLERYYANIIIKH